MHKEGLTEAEVRKTTAQSAFLWLPSKNATGTGKGKTNKEKYNSIHATQLHN